MDLFTIVHKTWPTFPRLYAEEGSHVLVVWPCGTIEHPIHVSHEYDKGVYPWPKSVVRIPVSDALHKAIHIALEVNESEAVQILLEYRDEIKAICDAAPTRLFAFPNNRSE